MGYDYLIVGAGLYGAVCARELTNLGKRCLVIDRRDHIAGNCYTQPVSGIQVHKYGVYKGSSSSGTQTFSPRHAEHGVSVRKSWF